MTANSDQISPKLLQDNIDDDQGSTLLNQGLQLPFAVCKQINV